MQRTNDARDTVREQTSAEYDVTLSLQNAYTELGTGHVDMNETLPDTGIPDRSGDEMRRTFQIENFKPFFL